MTLTEETAKELNENLIRLLSVVSPKKVKKSNSKKAEMALLIKKQLSKHGL